MNKVCSKCGKEKPVCEFYTDKRIDKPYSYCKQCHKNYRNKAKEKDPGYFKRYYHETKGDPAKIKRRKQWENDNKEKLTKYRREFYLKNRESILSKQKEYRIKNRESIIKKYQDNKDVFLERSVKYRSKNKEMLSKKTKEYYGSPAKFETYSKQISFAEKTSCDADGNLIVKCAYCGKEFAPKTYKVANRIKSLNGKLNGENRFYCSDKCKKECPIYKAQKNQKGISISTSREVPADFRHIALEDRNWTCEKCGSTENGLHVHHIDGYTEQPMFAADLKNVIVVCKRCHKAIHKMPGCSYNDYKCYNRGT